jgi:hypothetical protein
MELVAPTINLSDLPADRYAIDNPERDKMLILPLSRSVLHWCH